MGFFRTALYLALICIFATHLLLAQPSAVSAHQDALDQASDLQVMLEALATVEPVTFDSQPKNRRGQVMSVSFMSMQHPEWPPLPGNFYGLDVWPLGEGHFVLDDRKVDYAALEAAARLEEAASLNYTPQLRMMSSSLASYAYGNPVYLTNLVVTSSSGLTAAFDIAGGTNNVPYDIQTTTNLLTPWNWLGIGYTSNRYTFSSQPMDAAFYRLAKPSKTMTVGWGGNAYGQCDVWPGLTNVLQVAGGYSFSLALLNDGTVTAWGYNGTSASLLVPTNLAGVSMIASGWNHNVALLTNGTVRVWGDNFWGQLNLPAGLTNAVVVSAQAVHSLALLTNGKVVAWGYDSGFGEANVPAALTNVTAIAAGTWHNLAVSNGFVVTWGYNFQGQCNVPAGLSNVVDVAASFSHSVALKRDGTVVCWGGNGDGEIVVPTGLSNVVAIAAGGYIGSAGSPSGSFTLAVKSDGSLVVWGSKSVSAVLNGVNHVIGVGAGTFHALAIRTGPPTPVVTLEPVDQYQVAGGSVSFSVKGQGLYGVTYQWQTNGVNLTGATNTTLTLTNVQLAQQGSYRAVVTDNAGYGSIASSNANLNIITPPVFTYQSTPTNQVTIYGKRINYSGTATAPGMMNGFSISYGWQFNGTNLSGVTVNAYGFNLNDNNPGIYTLIASNAAGSASVSWQVTQTNFIDVTQDLLLIYNTNSADSTTCLNYYLAHRPNVTGANVLGIGYTNPTSPNYFETVTPSNLTSQILNPISNWLTNNPTKRPQYVILFMDLPSRVNNSSISATNGYSFSGVGFSVSIQISSLAADWQPYVTHLNMGSTNIVNRTNDCIAYINKLASIGVPVSSNSPVLSASLGGYANTNYVLDGVRFAITNSLEYFAGNGGTVSNTIPTLLTAGVSSNAIYFRESLIVSNYQDPPGTFISAHFFDGMLVTLTNYGTYRHLTNAANVAGYASWGVHGNISGRQTVDGTYKWSGNSGWYLINTLESHNGKLYTDLDAGQGCVSLWYSKTAFGGTNYANTPVGAVSTVDEPGLSGKNDNLKFFGLWANGKNFGVCAWDSKNSGYFQAVGDPLIKQ